MPIFRLYDGKTDKTTAIQATSLKDALTKFDVQRGVAPVAAEAKPKRIRKKKAVETPTEPVAPATPA